MNLDYAVDRLYEAGWLPTADAAVEREFAAATLQLSIKHNLMFSCYRATWAPVGERLDVDHETDDRHGTVVGSCEREAAVYALAQLRSSAGIRQIAMA